MNPTTLVTGAAGFIGSHVANELVRRNHQVIGLDDLSGAQAGNLSSSVELVHGSICDADLVAKLFRRQRIDYVFHFAAYAAEGLSHFIRRFIYSTNISGSATVINEAVNSGTIRCFVFASSIAVYGQPNHRVTEEDAAVPTDPYGISKRAVELDLAAARQFFGLPYIIFRLHNVYGPGQNLYDPYRNVVGTFVRQCMEESPMTIYGDGSQTRGFTHIDEVASIIAEAPEFPNAYDQIFNLGTDENRSILDLAECVARAVGIRFHPQFLPARNETIHASADHQKARDCFRQIIKNKSFDEGMAELIRWARTAKQTPRFARPAYEIAKGMPENWRRVA